MALVLFACLAVLFFVVVVVEVVECGGDLEVGCARGVVGGWR
jgi:hypothetical protein